MPQEYSFNKNFSRQCVHTKNIYSLLDMPKQEEAYKRLNKHIESCAVCADELKKFQSKTLAAQAFIPKVMMARDLRQSFDREVGELFKIMDLNERELLKKNVKKGFRFIDSMGAGFLKNLGSKAMIKAYVLAALMFLALKFIL